MRTVIPKRDMDREKPQKNKEHIEHWTPEQIDKHLERYKHLGPPKDRNGKLLTRPTAVRIDHKY